MRRRLLVLLLLLVLVASSAWGSEEDGVALRELDGRAVTLGPPAEGRALVLHFWAAWCPMCDEDLANLERALSACGPDGPQVLAVNAGDKADVVAGHVAKLGIELPVLLDPKGRAWRQIDGRGLPMNLFWSVDERRTAVGPMDEAAWRRALAPLGCLGGGGP